MSKEKGELSKSSFCSSFHALTWMASITRLYRDQRGRNGSTVSMSRPCNYGSNNLRCSFRASLLFRSFCLAGSYVSYRLRARRHYARGPRPLLASLLPNFASISLKGRFRFLALSLRLVEFRRCCDSFVCRLRLGASGLPHNACAFRYSSTSSLTRRFAFSTNPLALSPTLSALPRSTRFLPLEYTIFSTLALQGCETTSGALRRRCFGEQSLFSFGNLLSNLIFR